MRNFKLQVMTAFVLLVFTFSAMAGSISMKLSGPGAINDSTIQAGKNVSVDIYISNDSIYSGFSFGFAFKSPDIKKIIHVSDNEDIEKSVLATGFPYDIRENPNSAIERFNKFILRARAVRRLGCASIDFCYVALGVFDGYWEVHLHPWDICAGKLLVEEAGGIVTNFENEKIDIYSKQILASNNKVHNEMLKILSLS